MRYLIYSEVPLNSGGVPDRLAKLSSSAMAHVLIPVEPVTPEHLQFLETEMGSKQTDEPPELLFAHWRLRQAIEALERAGFEAVRGTTVDGSPVDAIESAVESGGHDAVIVVTEPVGMSGWVHLDLPHRIERHIDRPVIHIELEPAH